MFQRLGSCHHCNGSGGGPGGGPGKVLPVLAAFDRRHAAPVRPTHNAADPYAASLQGLGRLA